MKVQRYIMNNLVFNSLYVCIIILIQPVYGVEKPAITNENKNHAKTSTNRISLAGYPVVLYTLETSLIFGGGGAMTIRDQNSHESARPDNINFYAIYTLKNQVAVLFNPDFYFEEDKWQLKIMSGYQKFPDLFYGIGNKTASDDAEDITTEDVIIRTGLTRRIYKNLRLGVMYHFNHTSVQHVEPDGQIKSGMLTGSQGSLLSGLGPIIDWDSRDNIFYPSKGYWFQFYATVYRDWLDSEFAFESYTFDFRHFLEIELRQILALQLVIKSMKGTIPFNQLARLDMLRGIHASRFRDHNLAVAQVEYRFPVYKRFSGVLFTGIGDVIHRFGDFRLNDSKFSIGAGLRFAVLPDDKINLRFDIGFSRFGINPYFQLSEAF
ncbi:MAG: outer membrane protein assembly factor [Candidatus Marinimicrobia bacterium]|nr:outer membrane protein assembly factor [Candidatus Neomarinimicrobiota bacterium]